MQARIDELWDWDDASGSEARFRAEADESADERERRILLTQVARALGLQGNYADALALLDSLPSGQDPESDVRLLLERGRVLNSSDRGAAARPLFEEAQVGATDAGLEHLAIDALHMVAIVAPPEEQLALNQQAIAMAESATDPRARQWLASLYNNIGWTQFDAGHLDEALRLFERALQERLTRGQLRETNIARWAVARTHRAMGKVDQALAEQQDIRRSNAEAGVHDPYVDEEIAECLVALGRADEAQPYVKRARALSR